MRGCPAARTTPECLAARAAGADGTRRGAGVVGGVQAASATVTASTAVSTPHTRMVFVLIVGQLIRRSVPYGSARILVRGFEARASNSNRHAYTFDCE